MSTDNTDQSSFLQICVDLRKSEAKKERNFFGPQINTDNTDETPSSSQILFDLRESAAE